jgi:hypothetical protein
MMGGLTMSNVIILLLTIFGGALLIVSFIFITNKAIKKKQRMWASKLKKEKEDFHNKYPQFFVRENWELIGCGIFKFIPTNDFFEICYGRYSTGNILKDQFNTPEGFKNIFSKNEVGYVEAYLWSIVKNDINNERQKIIEQAKEKYPPKD